MGAIISDTSKWKRTKILCYLNYICAGASTQIIGLLLTSFERKFGLSVGQLTVLVNMLFSVLLVGIPVMTIVISKTGYRLWVILENVLNLVGLAGLGLFGFLFSNPYHGLFFAVACYSVAGCISEASTSAIIGSTPAKNKDRQMNMLHAVNGWGLIFWTLSGVAVFNVLGENKWFVLPIAAGAVALINMFFALTAQYPEAVPEGDDVVPLKDVFKSKIFILLLLMIMMNGAIELCLGSWVSRFTEVGLHIDKSKADLLGPATLTLGMALSRTFFGLKADKIHIEKGLLITTFGAFVSHMIIVLAPIPALSFVGCFLEGLCAGLMCPGIMCLLVKAFPRGGAHIFGTLNMFMYIGIIAANTMVSKLTTAAANGAVPEGFQTLLHASTPDDLGMKLTLFIIGMVALVMFFVTIATIKELKKVVAAYEASKTTPNT